MIDFSICLVSVSFFLQVLTDPLFSVIQEIQVNRVNSDFVICKDFLSFSPSPPKIPTNNFN